MGTGIAEVSPKADLDVVLAPDRARFRVTALLITYFLATIRMFEQGLASAEDIDRGMVTGCAHPMGPLALANLIGLDMVMRVAEPLNGEHREQLFAPPPMPQRLVAPPACSGARAAAGSTASAEFPMPVGSLTP